MRTMKLCFQVSDDVDVTSEAQNMAKDLLLAGLGTLLALAPGLPEAEHRMAHALLDPDGGTVLRNRKACPEEDAEEQSVADIVLKILHAESR